MNYLRSFTGTWLPITLIDTNPTVASFLPNMYLCQFGYDTEAYLNTWNQSTSPVTITLTNPKNNQTLLNITADVGYNQYNITNLLSVPLSSLQNVPYVSITASKLYVLRLTIQISATLLPHANFQQPSSGLNVYNGMPTY